MSNLWCGLLIGWTIGFFAARLIYRYWLVKRTSAVHSSSLQFMGEDEWRRKYGGR